MAVLVEKGDPGTQRPLIIDGIVISKIPATIDAEAEPIGDYVDMLDGGAREFQRRPHFQGVANYNERYTFSVTYSNLKGDDREKMEEIRVRGGIHRVAIFRMVPIIWTCIAGLQRYYLPRFRKIAAHVYAGVNLGGGVIVDTVQFPAHATRNGADLGVTYANGPALAAPAAGGIVIAKNPDAWGDAVDYTAVMLGDNPASGDVLKLWACLTFEVSMRSPRIRMAGLTESHSYTFVEV